MNGDYIPVADHNRLRAVFFNLLNNYSPHWNHTAKKYECNFCRNQISSELNLKRAESHRPGCEYIQALAYGASITRQTA